MGDSMIIHFVGAENLQSYDVRKLNDRTAEFKKRSLLLAIPNFFEKWHKFDNFNWDLVGKPMDYYIGKDDSGKRVALASYDFREHKANLSRESIAWHAKLRQAKIIIDRQAKTIDFQNKQLINLAGKDEWQRMMLEQAKQDASIKRMYNPQPSPFGGYGMLGGYGGMGGAQMGGGDEDSGSE